MTTKNLKVDQNIWLKSQRTNLDNLIDINLEQEVRCSAHRIGLYSDEEERKAEIKHFNRAYRKLKKE